jgi:hypothetical protein
MFVFSNLALANRNLPAIICCSTAGPGWRVPSRIDVSVQRSDIAPPFSRLRRISSRATVRRNAGEPFLLVRFARACGDAGKNSHRPFEGVSCLPGQTDK